MILKIEDDGKGIGAEAGKGHGLSNMRKRLEKIGGSCEVASEESGGTTIKFEVHLMDIDLPRMYAQMKPQQPPPLMIE